MRASSRNWEETKIDARASRVNLDGQAGGAYLVADESGNLYRWVQMASGLHLIKLCVGADSVEDLAGWQAARIAESGAAAAQHVTRMWPKRGDELLDGGSLYWVIRGVLQARQRIVGLEPRDGADGVRRCAILLDPEIVRIAARPRRPFQGWRYLRETDAPRDVGAEARTRRPAPCPRGEPRCDGRAVMRRRADDRGGRSRC